MTDADARTEADTSTETGMSSRGPDDLDPVEEAMARFAESVPSRPGDGEATTALYRVHTKRADGSCGGSSWRGDTSAIEDLGGFLNVGDVAVIVVVGTGAATGEVFDDEPF